MASVSTDLWDCRICTTKGLLFDAHTCCPNCGFARDVDEPRAACAGEAVTLATHRFSGTDSSCCWMGWSASARCCGSCGEVLASVGEAAAAPRVLRPSLSAQPSRVHQLGQLGQLDQPGLLARLEGMGFGEISPALAAGLAELFHSQEMTAQTPSGELGESASPPSHASGSGAGRE